MKKLVQVSEVENEGMIALLGKPVLVFCLNYIYTGILSGVNETCIQLEKARIVYETGAFTDKKFTDAQELPFCLYIKLAAIESFSETNKE